MTEARVRVRCLVLRGLEFRVLGIKGLGYRKAKAIRT